MLRCKFQASYIARPTSFSVLGLFHFYALEGLDKDVSPDAVKSQSLGVELIRMPNEDKTAKRKSLYLVSEGNGRRTNKVAGQ